MKKLLSKLHISSQWFIFIAALYFAFVLNITFWRYAFQNISLTGFNVVIFALSLVFFMAAPIYLVFNLLCVKYITKPLIITLLIISSYISYIMWRYGIFIDADMVQNAFQTNTREAMDFVTVPGVLTFLLTGILPAALVLVVKIEYKPFLKELKLRSIFCLIAVIITLLFAGASYKEYASFGRNHREARRLINPGNYIYATIRYYQRQARAKRVFELIDPEAKHNPYDDAMLTLLVLIIGETARAQNFSLYGYERETNPLLSKQDIAVFKDTTSCGTSTAISVPCIFSSKTRGEFNAGDSKFEENLIDLAHKTNYDVIWLENDDGCKGVCERVPTEEMIVLNNPKYCDGTYCKDEMLLDGLEERIANIKKDTIIVLHTMGSHGPTYYRRYPDNFKVFRPTCDTADIQTCSLEAIKNTYDNTILYADFIASSAIDIVKKFPQLEAGVMYVSDHGESLGENNIYLHGFPYKLAPKEQVTIPMIMWMNENMKLYDHVDYDCLKKHAQKGPFSHDNLFHSLIGLFEINSLTYNKNLDMFDKCRTKPLPGV